MASSRSLRPDDLPGRLRARLVELPAAVGGSLRLTVAFSGGLDSTVLLHLLARLRAETGFLLSALHVNHGLSAHADAWAKHCEHECSLLDVPVRVVCVSVPVNGGKGVEAAARDARYAALQQSGADWVVLAHHADDQAETLLHRLVRGCGVAGASAMRERDFVRGLWRPLLAESRSVLEAWAREHGLVWVEDDSNPDLRFTRNFLRHSVLTPLKARFPAAPENLLRATQHFSDATELLRELAEADALLVGLGSKKSRIRFGVLSVARKRNALRHWILQAGELAPDAKRLDECLGLLLVEKPVRWVHGRLAVCAFQGRVWLEPALLPVPEPVRWQGEEVLSWGGGSLSFLQSGGTGALRLDLEAGDMKIELRRGGERMRLVEGRPTRLFKQMCQEAGIPLWWRERLPLLWQGNELVWIGGIGAATGFQVAEGESGWSVQWRDPVFFSGAD